MADFYSRLLELRRAEGAARGLSKLPTDFYLQAQSFLAEVRRTYETELRENPSGRKGEVARQTHGRAVQLARDLVEARMAKIFSAAFQASVGGGRELANGLAEERSLFDRLVDVLRDFRRSSAPYLETPVATTTPTAAAAVSAPHQDVEAPRGSPRVGASPDPMRPPMANVFVRVLQGSPPIELGGETLELRAEDVLTLPPEIARILLETKAAERIAAEDPVLLG